MLYQVIPCMLATIFSRKFQKNTIALFLISIISFILYMSLFFNQLNFPLVFNGSFYFLVIVAMFSLIAIINTHKYKKCINIQSYFWGFLSLVALLYNSNNIFMLLIGVVLYVIFEVSFLTEFLEKREKKFSVINLVQNLALVIFLISFLVFFLKATNSTDIKNFSVLNYDLFFISILFYTCFITTFLKLAVGIPHMVQKHLEFSGPYFLLFRVFKTLIFGRFIFTLLNRLVWESLPNLQTGYLWLMSIYLGVICILKVFQTSRSNNFDWEATRINCIKSSLYSVAILMCIIIEPSEFDRFIDCVLINIALVPCLFYVINTRQKSLSKLNHINQIVDKTTKLLVLICLMGIMGVPFSGSYFYLSELIGKIFDENNIFFLLLTLFITTIPIFMVFPVLKELRNESAEGRKIRDELLLSDNIYLKLLLSLFCFVGIYSSIFLIYEV